MRICREEGGVVSMSEIWLAIIATVMAVNVTAIVIAAIVYLFKGDQ